MELLVDLDSQEDQVKTEHLAHLEPLVSVKMEHPDQLDHQDTLAEMVKMDTLEDPVQSDLLDHPGTLVNLDHPDILELKD